MTRLCLLTMALAVWCAVAAADDPPDYQKLAASSSWEWRPERASVLYSAVNAPKEYAVEVERDKDGFGAMTVRILRDGKTLTTLKSQAYTTFVIDGGVLYCAVYDSSTSGCVLTAYDLKGQKELWNTHLQGIGPIGHFVYSNAVAVELVPDAILVRGSEMAGKYIEYVDRKTGKTIANKVFEKGFKQE